MTNICVITDTSVSLMPEEAKKLGIVLAPLSVIINGVEGKDLFEVMPEDVVKALKNGDSLSTSQPNLGFLDEMFENLKGDEYEHIFVLSIAGHLSGTFSAFQLAANSHEVKNITFVDSKSAAGPIRHVAIRLKEMAKEDKSIEDMKAYIQSAFESSATYILPESLEQLRKGGRVKGSVATLSNLLNIKLCLLLAWETNEIEKFDTNRVELKLYKAIYEDMLKRGYSAKTHKIFLPHAEGMNRVEKFKAFILEKEIDADLEVINLPAGIAAHVGLGTFGVQTVLKA